MINLLLFFSFFWGLGRKADEREQSTVGNAWSKKEGRRGANLTFDRIPESRGWEKGRGARTTGEISSCPGLGGVGEIDRRVAEN